MLSMLMTTEYAPAEERRELQQLLICIAGGDRDALAELYQRTRGGVRLSAFLPQKRARRAGSHAGCLCAGVGLRGAVPPHRLADGVASDRMPQPLSDAPAAEERHAALSEEEWNAIPAQERGLDADERALLQGALARLADEERRIVLLHAVTGMKHWEIAALLELPLPTVLSKYHRALKKMRIFLEGDDAR